MKSLKGNLNAMKEDIFEGFSWHSSIGIDSNFDASKRLVSRLASTPRVLSMFLASGDNLLIHKTTRALWRLSQDKKFIEPTFDTDVLGEEEVREAMSED
jgi:hypothetical protein